MTAIEEAAQLIYEARKNRTTFPRLPEHLRPPTPQAAVDIQHRVTHLLGRTTVAWKCSLPKPDRIPFAPIFDLFPQGRVPVLTPAGTKIVEPEIAFVLNRDLPPRPQPYSESEIRASIGEAHLVIEIIGSRYADFMKTDYPEKVADHIVNESLVLGPSITAPIDDALNAFPVTVSGSTARHFDGKHPDGGPFGCFAWLVNYLRTDGGGLKKGQIVTTGSYAGFVTVPTGVPLQIQFGPLGALDLELVPA